MPGAAKRARLEREGGGDHLAEIRPSFARTLNAELLGELVDMFREDELHHLFKISPKLSGWFPPESHVQHRRRLERAVQRLIAESWFIGRTVVVNAGRDWGTRTGYVSKVMLPKPGKPCKLQVTYRRRPFSGTNVRLDRMVLQSEDVPQGCVAVATKARDSLHRRWIGQHDVEVITLAEQALRGLGHWAYLCPRFIRDFAAPWL